ncbi:hypothetical protein [Leeuwenhoekiella blandensis]|uniref:Uncharacterized protein n=1 Tax=Leeuwenhoekiella blandensis (strain CECT 7118 / CCUG 51940 / KCTC 22103 / MED217) TaxID=398720 RepID=A3XQG6_LEEBM|nr:hypothetical protein [Leeuwenhoekiella blandensis]EAQ48204.1 hypothetical protein MED217_00360 [Leeuwenhoekiella blandensis MED217]
MNYLLGMLMLVFAAKGCEEQLAYTSIDYEASSRGIYYHIHVEGDQLMVENTRDGSDKITKTLTSAQVNELNRLAQAYVATTSGDTENTSDAAAYDAAVPVTFVLMSDSYSRSAKFDRGSPPAQLAPLVGRLLLLAETE